MLTRASTTLTKKSEHVLLQYFQILTTSQFIFRLRPHVGMAEAADLLAGETARIAMNQAAALQAGDPQMAQAWSEKFLG